MRKTQAYGKPDRCLIAAGMTLRRMQKQEGRPVWLWNASDSTAPVENSLQR